MKTLRQLNSRFLIFCSLLVVAMAMSGCATGKIEQVRTGLTGRIPKTDQIYVKDFDASKAVFKGDYSDVPEKVALQQERIPMIISEAIIDRLQHERYDARKFSAQTPSDALVVDGEITLVDSGSAAARFWVGVGAGRSTVRANVRLYRASDPARTIANLQLAGISGGRGGFTGYEDWVAINAKDLGTKLAKYLDGK
jgi:hypothetical protein